MEFWAEHHRLQLRPPHGGMHLASHQCQVHDRRQAMQLLSPCMHDSRTLRRLRELLGELNGHRPAAFSDAQVVEQTVSAVMRERVELWLAVEPERAFELRAVPEPEEIEPLLLEPEPDDSRIAIQVLDEATGEPIRGVALSITLPDGSIREHRTDDDGLVDLREIPEGACDVASDRASRHRGQSLAYRGSGYYTPQRRRRHRWTRERLARLRSTTGLESSIDDLALVDVLEYRVRSGDTLASIAQAHGLTTDDITSFNWDTTDPAEVNRALAAEVGCTRRTSPSGDFEFSDADEPGVVLVPRPFRLDGRPTDTRHILRTAPLRPSPQWVFSL